MKPTRILLFAGGKLGDWAIRHIRPDDWLVGVDRGAMFLVRHGFAPRLSIGDFDSVTAEEMAEIERHSLHVSSCDPVMKDLTDTEMALAWAIQQKPAEIVLLGVLGSRFDHTLANVQLLHKALQAKASCRIVDERNEIRLVDSHCRIEQDHFAHVSLLPLTAEVSGITLRGFMYPLENATLRIGDTLGISNVLTEQTGTIDVATGQLLVIKSKD
ncbi:thiamine pyrophosphokinase [Brevibacillus agri]|uniref:Thiamine diphosphokinase n=1 Tax=Brevibacillus agri TaxID=51101 RepID=A0A3M8ARF1_9BACL|nr:MULTISPECIES: thiamine diphosphokinase [Bacillota]MBG9567501.1 thiamine pyrophosphokinase [Brevibacillus agri]MBY0052666.1 thiamine diphosphokinase [Brevibacillus agri]MCG5250286.1 thiamine diphosphokinase [Brevibacillus agri]MDN4091608.1 thiamine diphosphokinase [Brevibacillus agri]MDR9504580.1 thiamine diphosphokinase [Brevibacillus agri]